MESHQADSIRKLVLTEAETLKPEAGDFAAKPLWQSVHKTGTTLWLDTGDLDAADALWCSEFAALTTNNTLLNKEVQKGTYDALVEKVWAALKDTLDRSNAVIEIAFVLNAVHALRLASRFNAKVSVELHTDVANDVERTLAYARRYYAICPDSFIIKVPLTPAGLIATRILGEEGVPVNFTLGFSARQNFLATAVAQPAYVNVFLGRLNAFVADNDLGDGQNIGERTTLASQRAVREVNNTLSTHVRQIAASMRNGDQVSALLGVDVFTMPTKVAEEFEAAPIEETDIRSRVDEEPPVSFADGVDPDALTLNGLWTVPEAFKAAVMEAAKRNPSDLTPSLLQDHFVEAGFPDILPKWSEDDFQAAREDGKIARLDRWKDRLTGGEVALDAVMNLSALMSFTTDQAAMDDRIEKLLQ